MEPESISPSETPADLMVVTAKPLTHILCKQGWGLNQCTKDAANWRSGPQSPYQWKFIACYIAMVDLIKQDMTDLY